MSDQLESSHHKVFGNLNDMPSFEWSDLDGKTLDMAVSRDECGITVAGIDKGTGVIYVLHQQIFPEERLRRSVDKLAGELADALERSMK
ncbi:MULTISPECIES: hypothetical protein [Paenibacillus]|uniref:Uncharacterized protein n=1 Tax=Paenibacillus macerans TaxID=44252 RepID=A0A090Z7P9_PAEMA|nr:hypothetical protein [Paenibacillus macerans]KFN07299.1 hypothetical protein DJ90_5691 [Paenibacillus macerans]MCY7558246.1 hypothetical protein [Paenibacillus macerans]MEC0154616.1 hypothetical protein [Paenibacillus macerans]SUA85651.1 Uncharacterised protein [Paenibacillus macerans]